MRPTPQVAQWADELEMVRDEMGLDPRQYPTALGLTFIHVESLGDPRANRPRSEFHGLLQMGRAAGIDAGLPDRGRTGTTRHLLDEPVAAIQLWYRYMQRYAARWGYAGAPLHLSAAALWKGGPGTARRIMRKVQQGWDIHRAARWIETHDDPRIRIHNMAEYLRRMDARYSVWVEWTRTHDALEVEGVPVRTTPPEPSPLASLVEQGLAALLRRIVT